MTKNGQIVRNPIIDSDKILTFPYGSSKFEKYTTYVAYHKEENDINTFWLEFYDALKINFYSR